jgi:hypothetical protein
VGEEVIRIHVGVPRSFRLALTEVGTSLLLTLVDTLRLVLTLTSPGAMGATATTRRHKRSRRVSPQPVLVDLDCGNLQIGRDGVKRRD